MAAPPINPNEATLRLDDYTEFTQQFVVRVSSGGPTRPTSLITSQQHQFRSRLIPV